MKYKIAAAIEIMIACILAVMIFSKGMNTVANWRAGERVMKGLNFLEQDKLNAARKEFYQAIKIHPQYLPAKQSLLYVLLYSETSEEENIRDIAEELLSQTENEGPHAAAAYMVLGVLESQKYYTAKTIAKKINALKGAEKEFRRAFKADPNNADALVNRAIVNLEKYHLAKTKNKKVASKFLNVTYSLLRKARSSDSISIHALFPFSSALGQVYLEQNKIDEALKEMVRSAGLDRSQNKGFTNLAVAYTRLINSKSLPIKKKLELINNTNQLVDESNPVYYSLQCAIGKLYFGIEKFDVARGTFRSLSSKNKKKSTALANYGLTLFAKFMRYGINDRPKGPISNTFGALNTALKKKDITPRAQARCLNIMAYCRRLGYPFERNISKIPKQPVDFLREAVRLDPNYFVTARNLGVVLQELRKWTESLDYYKRSLQFNPGQSDLKEAIRIFEEKPTVSNARFFPPLFNNDPEGIASTTNEMPAILLTAIPAYPGRIDMDASNFWIDDKPQNFRTFVTDYDLLIIPRDYLSNGIHTFKAQISDAGRHKMTFIWKFVVDLTPPEIRPIEPLEGKKVNTESIFSFEIIEDASGIDFNSLRVRIQGKKSLRGQTLHIINRGRFLYEMDRLNIKMRQSVTSNKIQFTLPASRPGGDYELSIEVRNRAGLSIRKALPFKLSEL